MSRPVTIKGLQREQARNVQRIADLQPAGAAGRAVQYATAAAHRYAVQITHVDTGAWRASHRMALAGLRGSVQIAPGAKNPRSGQPVSVYADVWAQRGGELAVYDRTIEEAGPTIADQALDLVEGAL